MASQSSKATISGLVHGQCFAAEVSGDTYDRSRRVRAACGLNITGLVVLATDDGKTPLTEESVVRVLDLMEDS